MRNVTKIYIFYLCYGMSTKKQLFGNLKEMQLYWRAVLPRTSWQRSATLLQNVTELHIIAFAQVPEQ